MVCRAPVLPKPVDVLGGVVKREKKGMVAKQTSGFFDSITTSQEADDLSAV